MEINKLLEFNRLAKEEGHRYSRKRDRYYSQVTGALGRHFVGIVGPRGSGKTVLLKQVATENDDSFYVSVDTIGDASLFQIAKTLSETYKIKRLLLDEIHFCRGFEGELKQIFDFLKVQVVFTSSVALVMTESTFDLSRRVQLISITPFSFREYLLFKDGVMVPPLTLDDILQRKWTTQHLQFNHRFKDYLTGGLFPFLLEELDGLPLLQNILETIIRKDIPSVAKLLTDEIGIIAKVVAFVGKSPVDGINTTSIAKNVGITKYKAEQYLQLLGKSFVVKSVWPKGTNVLKEPKVLLYLPYRLLYKSYDEAIGALREDFFAEAMMMANMEFHYLKSTRGMKTPDFLVRTGDTEIIMEVGGKGKGREQFKGMRDKEKIRLLDSDASDGNCRPLIMLGYLV